MHISVLIPTYRRSSDLARCLAALEQQRRVPDEVLLVVRSTDEETTAFLNSMRYQLPIRVVLVEQGGQVNALNAGLDAVAGDIVMITDDDTQPHAHWVALAEGHFAADPQLGGVGGRDVVHHPDRIEEGPCTIVGRVRWFGRLTGNHHLIAPGKMYVDILKGANMSYRMEAVGLTRFDTYLRGTGAQVGNDMAFSLALRKKGWRLLYDPEVSLNHFPAQRHDNDQRGARNLESTADMSFNTYWTLQRHLQQGLQRWAALTWESLIGTDRRPGRLRSLRSQLKRDTIGRELGVVARRNRKEARLAYERYLRVNRSPAVAGRPQVE